MPLKKNFLTDILISILLLAATLYYAARYVDFTIPPFEDAAMLMRYSQHLAGGHGIVWNIGEHPVDGATDFLFMVSAALLIKLGLTVGQAVRGIGFVSHILTVLIVYWTNRRVHNGDIFLSLFSALYLVVGTGLSYVAAYFGTPFFALAAASTWTLGLLLAKQETPSFGLNLAFAFSGLITGLIRPEGVILASLILLMVVIMRGWKNSMSIIVTFAIVFLLLGGSYFAWRWNYFGYPLPNPFYKKGDGGLYWGSYDTSLWNTLRLCLPFAILALLGFRSRETTRQAIAYLVPILGFASAFILISDEMNFGARFQYALVPIVLISWIPLLGGFNFSWLNQLPVRERIVHIVVLTALALSLVYYSWSRNCFVAEPQLTCSPVYGPDGRYEMGKLLSEYRGKGYTIVTTEAGLIPYYSGWTAVDAWGLNDQWIAHNGGITAEYLDQFKPEVIMFHAHFSPLIPPRATPADLAEPWFKMTYILLTYAESNGYQLAAVFGDSPYDTNYYYVRPDFEDSGQILRQISRMKNYYWQSTWNVSVNFANYQE
jgi:hypothetical protein